MDVFINRLRDKYKTSQNITKANSLSRLQTVKANLHKIRLRQTKSAIRADNYC